MDPSDTFESFDLNNFDNFLARESFEDECERSAGSAASSFSDSFDMMPVYRSLEVMPEDIMGMGMASQSGIDMVFEPPALSMSRPSLSRGGASFDSSLSSDLFSTLNRNTAHSSLPSVHDPFRIDPLTPTSFALTTTLASLSSSISSFLGCTNNGTDTYVSVSEHCETSSLWKCEAARGGDSCRFHVQLYSHVEGKSEQSEEQYTVEFLRVSGCPLLFNNEFRRFKTLHTASPPDVSPVDTAIVPSLTQEGVATLVNWASTDATQATAAVCALLPPASLVALLTPSSQLPANGQLGPDGILAMTLLGSLCVQCKDRETLTCSSKEGSSWSLPLLSLLRLLLQTRSLYSSTMPHSSSPVLAVLTTLMDSLVPTAARLALSSDPLKGLESRLAGELMDML